MQRRFLNPSQPQTIQIAVFLLYANVVVALLFRNANGGEFGGAIYSLFRSPSAFDAAVLLGNLLTVGFVAGSAVCGYLIANEKRTGWRLGVVVAAAPLVAVAIILLIGYPARASLASIDLIGLLFDGALLALLLHPQTRDYERIWFK